MEYAKSNPFIVVKSKLKPKLNCTDQNSSKLKPKLKLKQKLKNNPKFSIDYSYTFSIDHTHMYK